MAIARFGPRAVQVLAVVQVGALGCGGAGDRATPCRMNRAIVNGTPDDDNAAVVALVDAVGDLVCSGTLVAVQAGFGYVLTAAHCTGAVAGLLAGPDAVTRFPAAGSRLHPRARFGTASDLAVVRLLGLPGHLPVVAPLTPDEDRLVAGDQVEFVGWGTDATGASGRRQRFLGRIAFTTESAFSYRQTTGGPCSGDSGGPALIAAADGKRIAGVPFAGTRAARPTA
jgi:hypothetical protein